MLRSFLLAALFAVMSLTGAMAQAPAVEADHVWARATPAGAKTAVLYMTLVNKGAAADRLVSVSTPAAGEASLHETTVDNGMTRMRPIAALDVKPGTPTVLQPGGLHVMLTELKGPLIAGQKFSVTLTFANAGKVDVTAVVEKVGAMKPDAMPGMKM
ncbi:MAG TPA: copper chaperone PCu(A)C [Stellaceae bacterium]|nr:copper chaperone PCu(A)C [Stellaceae bacterium]